MDVRTGAILAVLAFALILFAGCVEVTDCQKVKNDCIAANQGAYELKCYSSWCNCLQKNAISYAMAGNDQAANAECDKIDLGPLQFLKTNRKASCKTDAAVALAISGNTRAAVQVCNSIPIQATDAQSFFYRDSCIERVAEKTGNKSVCDQMQGPAGIDILARKKDCEEKAEAEHIRLTEAHCALLPALSLLLFALFLSRNER